MAVPPVPGPVYLGGSKPGVFDPTQPARLLRYSDSTLLFASFNPPAGSGPPLSADALARARRIVVEVPRANHSNERPKWFSFVPNAVLAPGVTSEGEWPRAINYCGWWVTCDQDQWDIHKLDPMYECFVPPAGMNPIITKKISVQGGAALYPEDHIQDHDCPDVPMGDTTPAALSTFTAPSARFGSSSESISSVSAASASAVGCNDHPLPPNASPTVPSSLTRSPDQPRPRTPDITDSAMDANYNDKDEGKQARAEKPARTRLTDHERSATEDVLVAELSDQGAAVARCQALALHALLEQRRRQRMQEHREQWMPWTPRRAIDRYLAVSEEFDSARFSHENPVDLLFVPWPVLHSPFTLHVSQVDWPMVEAFFKAAANQMVHEDYRAFVEESYRRFHPDRWSSRGVFRTHDSELARALQRACTVISQALGAIRAASKQW